MRKMFKAVAAWVMMVMQQLKEARRSIAEGVGYELSQLEDDVGPWKRAILAEWYTVEGYLTFFEWCFLRLWCKIDGHAITYEGEHAGPESGTMGCHCKRCGWEHYEVLY